MLINKVKKNIYICIALLSLVLPNKLFAQEIYKLKIEELISRGIENSVTLQASTLKVKISESKTGISKARRMPEINISGLVGYVGKPIILDKDFSFMKHGTTPDWKQNYQVNFSQPIYKGGKIIHNIEKAELEEQLSALNLEKDKSELKLWLIGKYLDLFNLYKEKDVYEKNIEEAKARLHDIEGMKREGMITNNDVLRSQLEVTNYELALKTTNNDIELISQQLTIVMGMDESIILQPDESFLQTEIAIKSDESYVNQAYNQYPEMRITQTNIALAQNNLKLTKADLLPTLSLQASNTLARPIPNSSPVQDLYLNSWGVTLNLSYRISAWFDKKHTVGAAKQQIHLQELMQEQQKQTIRNTVKSAYIKHREALDRIDAMTKSLIQANENYRIVKNKYFNQLAILTDLLDANSVQTNAELQLISAKTNAIYTYYELQKVSGNL